MDLSSKIFIAGHRGMVGSAIFRALNESGYQNLVVRDRTQLDLRRQRDVEEFFEAESPDYVFMAAAKVGGIMANNTYRADFILENLQIETNVISASYASDVKKLLFLGSSCVYPKLTPQPIHEEYLLSGPLEQTSEPYAIAKIAGVKLCQAINEQHGTNYISTMPTNLYGPGDNFDLAEAHVLPALIRKFHEAKQQGSSSVEIWGTGNPRREFLHVDDCADAAICLMNQYTGTEIVNVGCGEDIAIRDLAALISDIVGFTGEIRYNPSYPDGTPRKLLEISRLASLGWQPRIRLRDGIESVYQWFLQTYYPEMKRSVMQS